MTSPLDTLPYAQAPKPKADHNRNYMVALLVLAFLQAMVTMSTFFILLTPKNTSTNSNVKGAFLFVLALHGLFLALMIATLIIRVVSHGDARIIWTKAMNIILLFHFSLGTALGIYGLLKVDKTPLA